MQTVWPYLLVPLMSGLLVFAQTMWATAIKHENVLRGGVLQIAMNLVSNWHIWAGAFLYIIATLVYFVMLSKFKFFSIQVTMTGLSIVFSVLMSILLFHESPSIANYFGILIVFIGIILIQLK